MATQHPEQSKSYSLAPDEKISLVMVYTPTSLIRDEVITKQIIRVSNWLRSTMAPQYLHLLNAQVACGTPVLSTPVGALPDYIKDGETGFIMENNSPGCIQRNVIRSLSFPYPEKIVINGQELLEREFTLKGAVKRYSEILMKSK